MNKDKRLNIRVTTEEFNFLKEKFAESKCKNFSTFIREKILDITGYHSATLALQLYHLRWEINKIGTNINQATRKINSTGISSQEDIEELLSKQEKINELMNRYEKLVLETWKKNL